MTFEHLAQVLNDAKGIHQALRRQVDFNTEDKKHAIYLLQGGALTAVTSARKFNTTGHLVPAAQQMRMIDEMVELIRYFDEIEEGSRKLHAWFKGRVIRRTSGNRGDLSVEERARMDSLTPEQIQRTDELIKELNNRMSKYMHPTIRAVRANVHQRTHIFDYDHEQTASDSLSAEIFGRLFMAPALHALTIPARTLPLSRDDFKRLRSYVDEIEGA